MWVLLSGFQEEKEGNQRGLFVPIVFQVSLVQNNSYVKVAYSQAAPSVILQHPPINH